MFFPGHEVLIELHLVENFSIKSRGLFHSSQLNEIFIFRLRNLEGNDDDRLLSSKASLLAAFFQLAETLKSNHKKWDKLLSNEEEVEAIVKVWVQCFEKKCQREKHAYYHQLIYGHAKATDIFLRLLRRSKNLEDENVNKEEMVLNSKMSKLDMTNKVKDIDRLLAQLASWMENNDVRNFSSLYKSPYIRF